MIDYDIWGQPENWNYLDQNRYHDIRQPSFIDGDNNYKTLYRAAASYIIRPEQPLDKSLCYSGMGAECPYSNVKYYYVDNGSLSDQVQKRSLTNWFFYQADNFSAWVGRTRTTCFFANEYGRQYRDYEQIVDNSDNANRNISPVVNFDYKKAVMLVRMVYSDSPTGSRHTGTLQDYISGDYQTYPYVYQVYGRLYYQYQSTPTLQRQYINNQVQEGYHYFASAILDDYVTSFANPVINRTYANHIATSRGCFIPILGLSYDNNYAYIPYSSDGLVAIVYGDINWTEEKDNSNNMYISYHVTDINAFKEMALRAAAAFGIYFTPDTTTAQSGSLTDEKMYIGVLDDNGVAHGDYLQGTGTAQAKQNTWDDARHSDYDPYADIDPTKYRNDTEFNLLYNASSVTTFYVLNDLQVNQLAQELYTILSNVPVDAAIEKYNQQVFLTNNAIDCIVSLKRFPLASLPIVGQDEYVKLGTQTTSIRAYRLQAPAKIYYFNFSSASDTSLYPHFNRSFLDYEPYTKAKINIPFCGSVEVPCTYLYDYGGVTVALAIDFITGGCTGYVICNGIVIDSVNGQCSVELPLSGIQSSTVDSQIFSASQQKIKQETSLGLGILAGAVAIGAGIATGGLAAVAGGALAIGTSAANYIQSERELDYELTHMQAPLKQVGAASGQISELYDTRCKMVITRPKINPEFENSPEAQEAYARTIGYACLLSGQVSDFTGFTVGSIDLDGVAATAEEKEMLKNYFASGVYL